MAWMYCRSCSALFAVGLLRCPQCQAVSELYAAPEEVVEAEQEQEAEMPKIGVGAGPSNALGGDAETPDPVTQVTESSDAEVTEPESRDLDANATPESADKAAPEAAEGEEPEPAAASAAKKRATKKTAPSPAK